jgi:hypothetical protein
MKLSIDVQLTGEQIAYILFRYRKRHGEWPKPKNGLYAAIKEYIAENGEPDLNRVKACLNTAPVLMSKGMELAERYFPYTFD